MNKLNNGTVKLSVPYGEKASNIVEHNPINKDLIITILIL